jgi:hypothetical protein
MSPEIHPLAAAFAVKLYYGQTAIELGLKMMLKAKKSIQVRRFTMFYPKKSRYIIIGLLLFL